MQRAMSPEDCWAVKGTMGIESAAKVPAKRMLKYST